MPQHSAEPTPHAGLGALGANLAPSQTDARDGLVNLQHLGQGLEAATDQGLCLAPELYRSDAATKNMRINDI